MPVIWIPGLLQDLTGGVERVILPGATVRQAIDALDIAYPGVRSRLMDGDRLRPFIAIAVNGEISPLRLRHKLTDSSEVHFLPAMSGGSRFDPD